MFHPPRTQSTAKRSRTHRLRAFAASRRARLSSTLSETELLVWNPSHGTDEDVDAKYRYVGEDLDGPGRGGIRRLPPFDRNLRLSSIEIFARISISSEKDDDRMDQGRSIPSVAHKNPTVWERRNSSVWLCGSWSVPVGRQHEWPSLEDEQVERIRTSEMAKMQEKRRT